MTAPAPSALKRVGFSLGALLVSVTLFCVLFTLVFGRLGSFNVDSFLFTFLATLVFALPVWCLYLPFILKLKDAEGWRLWVILVTGTLIGPVAMGLWAAVLLLNTFGLQRIVYSTHDLSSIGALMGFAFFVGGVTSAFYALALRRMLRRPR